MDKKGTLGVGIIGMGNIGKLHHSYMDEIRGAEIKAVCDINPEKLKLKSINDFDHQIEDDVSPESLKKYTNYKEMFDKENLDLVMIAAPHIFHKEMSIEAFERDIHVICEKPVAVKGSNAREIIGAWENSDSIFTVMFQKRTFPVFRKIKSMLNKGELGDIRRILWIKTDWFRTQAYYDSGGWRGNWSGEGGGVLINQSPHELDLFQWFFGLPKNVIGLGYLGKWHDITVEDEISCLMEMQSGAIASFVTSTGETPGSDRLEISGDKGKLIYNKGQLILERLGKPVNKVIKGSDKGFYKSDLDRINIDIPDKPSGHKVITQNAVNAILENEELIVSGEESINQLLLSNTILYSGIKKQEVEFPVDDKKFDIFFKELKKNELNYHSEKAFDWEEYLTKFNEDQDIIS